MSLSAASAENPRARLRQAVPLAPLTTWRIGGAAEYFAEPETVAELSALLRFAQEEGLDARVLGGGSNLLVRDGMLDGLVIRPHRGEFAKCEIDRETGIIACGAGGPLQSLLGQACACGLAGLEELAGIPGSVGGAARMNAGSHGRTFGELVRCVECLDESGRAVTLAGEEVKFFYRSSNLGEFLVTGVKLQLCPDKPEETRKRARAMLERKRAVQPLDIPSCGCVFKNPPSNSAGKLIDEAGCKGLASGACRVSEKHANFFVNEGDATCEDALRLIDLVRGRVEKATGIRLELEVCLWK